MHCPSCESSSLSTLESRHRDDDNTVRRRRRCRDCKFRFTTIELVDSDSAKGRRAYAAIVGSTPTAGWPEERVIRIRGNFVIERPPAPAGAAGGGP